MSTMPQSTIKVTLPQGKGHSEVVDYKFELLTADAFAALLSKFETFHYSDEGARHEYNKYELTLALDVMMKRSHKVQSDLWTLEDLIFIPYKLKEEQSVNKKPPTMPISRRGTLRKRVTVKKQSILDSTIASLKSDPNIILDTARKDPSFMKAMIEGLDAIITEQEAKLKEQEAVGLAQKLISDSESLNDEEAKQVEELLNSVGASGSKMSLNDLQKLLAQQQKRGAKQ